MEKEDPGIEAQELRDAQLKIRLLETEIGILREVAAKYREIAVEVVPVTAHGKATERLRKLMSDDSEMRKAVLRQLKLDPDA